MEEFYLIPIEVCQAVIVYVFDVLFFISDD